MDSRAPENTEPPPLRRSSRHASRKVFNVEPTPRGPLVRSKRGLENQAPVAAVNGSREVESGSEDGESPNKKSRLEPEGAAGGSGDENEMDVQESDEDQEMDVKQDSSHVTHQPKTCQGGHGDVNLSPHVVLGDRCQSSFAVNKNTDLMNTKRVKPSLKGPVSPTKSAPQIRSPANRHGVPFPKITSMDEYRRTMEDKAKSPVIPAFNHRAPSKYPASEKSYTTRQRVNNIPTQKEWVQHNKQGIEKIAVKKTSSGYSCRGFMWHLLRFVLLVVLGSAVLAAYKTMPVLQRRHSGVHPSRAVKLEDFANQLSLLETRFPGQRPELWKRSKIHLEKHLKTAQPTEPVSLIFTAGQRAEKTLRCLAQGLASSFSSALNASVLHIDGASKASQDSDEVKLDIDSQLKAAFEGDKPVAVIHRFEELPPGSTLIFYRYCDHENAAYKRVFLLFTVLLPQDEVSSDLSLKEVEEMVQDYVKERLVGSSNKTAFNEMDTDKYSGLWSRISHLLLPVVSEKEVEQKGC